MPKGGNRPKSGRKPTLDKKRAVQIMVRGSIIEKIGFYNVSKYLRNCAENIIICPNCTFFNTFKCLEKQRCEKFKLKI